MSGNRAEPDHEDDPEPALSDHMRQTGVIQVLPFMSFRRAAKTVSERPEVADLPVSRES